MSLKPNQVGPFAAEEICRPNYLLQREMLSEDPKVADTML